MREADGQMLLGSPEDGFTRSLKETDTDYLKAQETCMKTGGEILFLQDQIKKMKNEALEPIKYDLKELVTRLDALEHLYSYRRLAERLEEARVRSLEENAAFVVWVVSQKLSKLSEWCFVGRKLEFNDRCSFYGALNVFKVAEYAQGIPAGEEPGIEEARYE